MMIKKNTPFPVWPSYTECEAKAISTILLSGKVNYWTGIECRKFEEEFAAWCGAQHAVALANGTVALDLALKAFDIGIGDEVVVTSRTFLASVSCIVTAGAIPVFADVDSESQNITAATVEACLTPKTRAIICVHLAGWPCDMESIMNLAEKNDLYVIEDCAQAHGATLNGKMVGSIGHIGAWSFCQDKIMSTGGEGGMVTTNDQELWSKMWSYKDHGKSWEAVYEKVHPPGFRWLHDSFGTNWRMLEIQAAIGRLQLQRMAEWTSKRRYNANVIWDFARELPGLRVPTIPNHIGHAAYKCYVFVDSEQLRAGWDRDRVMAQINHSGVPCFTGSCSEVYLERAFDGTDWRPTERLPIAMRMGQDSLMFLVHPNLTIDEINLTCHVLKRVMISACG